MRPGLVALCALVLLLAGCGSSQRGEGGCSPATAERGVLPLDLLPDGARVIAAERSGSAIAGAVIFRAAPGTAQERMALDFSLAGWKIVRGGDRGFEAELWVRRGREEIRFKLFPSRRCPGYTQASFTRVT